MGRGKWGWQGYFLQRDQDSIHQQRRPFSKDLVYGEPTHAGPLVTVYFPKISQSKELNLRLFLGIYRFRL